MAAAPACRRWRLGNGLRLVHVWVPQAELVAVHVAYRVGAADEPDEAKGLAHLTEHLMYAGSRVLPGSHLRHLDAVGATDLNGSTGLDSTHYFQTVPRAALEFALHAEAGRMAAPLLRARDFQLQRRVVLEELQQRRAQAEQRLAEHWQACLHPAPHPYHRGSGGDAQQLAALSLHTLRRWHQQHCLPGNAVLVLAGDLSFAQARALVQRYFGGIANTAWPLPTALAPLPLSANPQCVQEALSAPRLYQAWRLSPDEARQRHDAWCWLQQLLTQRLQASAAASASQLRVQFEVQRLGASLSLILDGASAQRPAWLGAQWQQLLAQGFTQDEVKQVAAQRAQERRRRGESLQGLAAMAVAAELQRGDARLAFVAEPEALPDADALRALLRRYTTIAPLRLQVSPVSQTQRAARPLPVIRRKARHAAAKLRLVERGEGRIEAWLAARSGSGVLAGSLLLPAGARHEPRGQSGLAALSARLLAADETLRAQASAWQLRIDAQAEGTQLHWCCASEQTLAVLRALRQALQRPVSEASFIAQRQGQYERLLAQRHDLAARAQQRLAHELWRAPPLLGTAATLASLDRAALQQFREQQYRPGGTQLLLAGDAGGLRLDEELAAALSPWSGIAAPASRTAVRPQRQSIQHLEAAPGTRIALLTVAWPLPAPTPQSEAVLQLADQLLAGSFSSRLNLRLREQLGWSYGVRSAVLGAAPQRHYQIQCWLPRERASAALQEVRAALRWLAESLSTAQLHRAQDQLILSAPGRVERSEQLLHALRQHLRLGFDAAQWHQQYQRLTEPMLDALRAWAQKRLDQLMQSQP